MEQWNFYLSGILYGIFERRDDRIFHCPLDVYTGMPDEWKELAEDDTWYLELGKMNVRKALMELEAYEAGIRNTETRNTAAENTGTRNAE